MQTSLPTFTVRLNQDGGIVREKDTFRTIISHFDETHATNSIGYRLYFWMIFHMFESLLVRSLQSYYLKKNIDNFMVLMIEDKLPVLLTLSDTVINPDFTHPLNLI